MRITVGSGRATSAGWRIELLGDFRVSWGGQPLPGFRRQRATLLLAYLALRCGQGPAPRDRVMEALWPEGDPEASRTNLRTVLHALRRQLESPGRSGTPPQALLIADTATLSMALGAVKTDVAEFRFSRPSATINARDCRTSTDYDSFGRSTGNLDTVHRREIPSFQALQEGEVNGRK